MIKAILLDIDGTILEGGVAVPGAPAAIRTLRESGLKLKFMTNISAKTPAQIADALQKAGIGADADDVHSSTAACIQYLRSRGATYSDVLVPELVKPLFSELDVDNERPQFVVVGDVGDGFSYQAMNYAFTRIREGAILLAPQKNLWWMDADGPKIDSGAFVTALEAATCKQSIITGKPTAQFFLGALATFGVEPHDALVVGDDLNTDIAGAIGIGAGSALVLTGKGAGVSGGSDVVPDTRLDSIADLPAYVRSLLAKQRQC
jgi:inorganic pyrophosphatase